MLDIAVVDDSRLDRQTLLDYLDKYAAEKHLFIKTKAFETGESFLTEFEKTSFAVVFLDIYLEGLDGMETARKIREKKSDPLIIFSTNSEQHAVGSYQVRAFYYLVKPYTYEEFSNVMLLCEKTLATKARYIEVKESRVYIKILLQDILYVDYYKHYVQLHTRERVIRSYLPFREISGMLLVYPQFFCCYHDLIINLDEVASLGEKDVLMKCGERIPVSASRRSALRQSYANYVMRQLELENL